MEHIDTITADTIAVGDLIELWEEDESEEGQYIIEEALTVVDDDDFIIVTTDTFPDGMAILPHAQVRIFGY